MPMNEGLFGAQIPIVIEQQHDITSQYVDTYAELGEPDAGCAQIKESVKQERS